MATATTLTQSFLPRPRLLIFGAIELAETVAALGRLLGYRVTVVDARPAFADPARVPSADEVARDWPDNYLDTAPTDSRTVIVSLLHDEKFEIPALLKALRLDVAYVGAMGSRRTNAKRLEALRAAGLAEPEIARLHAPIGLDLGGRGAGELAVSIFAEVIAEANGRSGQPLTGGDMPIHPRASIPGVVLAAGAGTRYGKPKALATTDGKPWAARTAGILAAAGCDPVYVVTGAAADETEATLPPHVRPIRAADWQQGLSASVRAALETVNGTLLLTLVDTPGLTVAAVRRVLAAYSSPTSLARASYEGNPGHPVLIGAHHIGRILPTLSGDRGAGPYLAANHAMLVECADVADGTDIDTAPLVIPD
ncbi:MAG: XdhC family protein [Propionibacteriaceae bacterium]|jgi:xanthine dehydrogenase accessory factor|nr:XdhC family protein [Propionibacteriaceae bacterium]